MGMPSDGSAADARGRSNRGAPIPRTLLLAGAAIWFGLLALPLSSGDPAAGLPDLLHGLALGLALLAAALVDWFGLFGIE